MANTNLTVSDLDPDSLKTGFINFLKSQTQFRDYNFEGSNFSQLLNVFIYNTFNNAFLTNMSISEMFLDSAQLRDSVISRAKELNYIPRSSTSAAATINVTVVPTDSPAYIIMPEGTPFSARLNSDVYTFLTDSNVILPAVTGYSVSNVAIYEGIYVTDSYLVDNTITNQRFILSNQQVDTSSISVSVQNSNTDSTNTSFQLATTLLGFTGNSAIYFLQAADNLTYEIVFGQGIVGQQPINGNIVNVTYRVCQEDASNGANNFVSSSSIGGYSNIIVSTVQAAQGGAPPEDIASIKFNAPRHYQVQERAVTDTDYEILLREQFPEIMNIHAYGGEDASPPQYGKTFIVVELQGGNLSTNVQKDVYSSFIQSKMVNPFTPVFQDPDFIMLSVDLDLIYNLNVTDQTSNDISTEFQTTILNFSNNYLETFDTTFNYSQFITTLYNTDYSVTSSNVNILLYRSINPNLNTNNSIVINYLNSIDSGTISSTQFTFNGIQSTLVDDSNGNINIITTSNTNTVSYLANSAGRVDYANGIITLSNFNVSNYIGSGIKVYVESLNQDITVSGTTIIKILAEDITIEATPITK